MIPITPELIDGMERLDLRMDDGYNLIDRRDAKKPPSKRQGDKVWVTDPRAKGGGYWRRLKPGSKMPQGGDRVKQEASGGGKKKGGGALKTAALLAAGGVGAVLAARAGIKELKANVIAKASGISVQEGRKAVNELNALNKSLKKEYKQLIKKNASDDELDDFMMKSGEAMDGLMKKYSIGKKLYEEIDRKLEEEQNN